MAGLKGEVRGRRRMRRILAALDRALERLADVAYGPLPAGEQPAPLGSKLLLLALFGVLVALGVAS
jgi:hypothetical protein